MKSTRSLWRWCYCYSSLLVSSSSTTSSVAAFASRYSSHQHPLSSTSSRRSFTSTTATSLNTMTPKNKQIVVDPFCFRQFAEHPSSKTYKGTVFSDITIAQMEDIVNRHYNDQDSSLIDGYAPFCKHLFVRNDNITQSAKLNVLPITPDNAHLLRTEYQARNEKELPVLVRYFPAELLQTEAIELPVATYLDIILYSREQIQKEHAAQGGTSSSDSNAQQQDAPWGIVSIKAQDTDSELPMTPMTAMRNALGKEEGGSGVPLNRAEYLAAVEYWQSHATIS